jgi:hypothetical protein
VSQDRKPHVRITRALLRLRELCPFDCMVLTWIAFRANNHMRVEARDLVDLAGCHRSTAYNAFARLRVAGWIDADRAQVRPIPEGDGVLAVQWERVRALGVYESLTLTQCESLHALRNTTTTAEGTSAAPGNVASLIGSCRDTARRCLLDLASGNTVRHRQATRRGESVARVSWLACTIPPKGSPRRIRILGERERQAEQRRQRSQEAASKAREAATPAEQALPGYAAGYELVRLALRKQAPPLPPHVRS